MRGLNEHFDNKKNQFDESCPDWWKSRWEHLGRNAGIKFQPVENDKKETPSESEEDSMAGLGARCISTRDRG